MYLLKADNVTSSIPTLTAWEIQDAYPGLPTTEGKDSITIDATGVLHPIDVDLLAAGQSLDDTDMAREYLRHHPITK